MDKQKKIMLLGGIYYLKPVIEVAHEFGCYVITVDYLPNNIAHQWSDEYINASIIDKDAILKISKENKIDGILSFAVDPGVVTAAYVAEKLGLPFTCSYEAACILQDKSLFRDFLRNNGLNTPWAYSFSNYAELQKHKDLIKYPAIIKPVDSAGSKGVQRVDSESQLKDAFDNAIEYSLSHKVIIEEFLQKKGRSHGAEIFVENGKIIFSSYYDQFFEETASNPYVPYAESWPSSISPQLKKEMNDTIQRICDLLHVGTGIFNIECRQTVDDKIYLMEMSPRAGGNRLAEMIKCATGCDIITPEVQKAIGLDITTISSPNENMVYAILVIHTQQNGIFNGIEIHSDVMMKNVLSKTIYINNGDEIYTFGGANNAIGTLFMKFQSKDEMEYVIINSPKWLKIIVK
jgi:formate-dependent phosphoribosylglycinamide formyltransferase (GAR transformylase)